MNLSSAEVRVNIINDTIRETTTCLRRTFTQLENAEEIPGLPNISGINKTELVGLSEQSLRMLYELPGGVMRKGNNGLSTEDFYSEIQFASLPACVLTRRPLLFLHEPFLNPTLYPYVLTNIDFRGNPVAKLVQVNFTPEGWKHTYNGQDFAAVRKPIQNLLSAGHIIALAPTVEHCLVERTLQEAVEGNFTLNRKRFGVLKTALPLEDYKEIIQRRLDLMKTGSYLNS